MKLTKEYLRTLIKEAVEQKRLAKLVNWLTSDDLSVVEQGVELAISMGYDVELQRASSGFTKKEYDIFTSNEDLYNAIRKAKPKAPAGPVDPQNRLFVITIEVEP